MELAKPPWIPAIQTLLRCLCVHLYDSINRFTGPMADGHVTNTVVHAKLDDRITCIIHTCTRTIYVKFVSSYV